MNRQVYRKRKKRQTDRQTDRQPKERANKQMEERSKIYLTRKMISPAFSVGHKDDISR